MSTMNKQLASELQRLLENSFEISDARVHIVNEKSFRALAYRLAETSALGMGDKRAMARYVARAAALELGIIPASINDLYIARGQGHVPLAFTVPAINLRVLSFEAARAVFRTALKTDAAAMIFEIARSEIGYTDQEPSEYATSVLSAAISEGYQGPVFLQGDHFQVSASRYASDPKREIEALKALISKAIAAGFFNIDIDASTMVDLSKPTALEQQKLNIELSVMFSTLVRKLEPKGVTVSIGGEIGEVGGHNSTEEELRAYLDGYNAALNRVAPEGAGLSKISVQTGTSHGGVVLPDGSIAKVRVDFDTLRQLSRVARKDYGLGGTVQHGASTLPEEAFGKFVEYEACEVHLATNFANIFFDLIPLGMKEEMYAYLREKHASARKRDMTDEQFYYQARKNAIGPFKAKSWSLPVSEKAKITSAWEQQFTKLFTLLGANGTRQYIEKFIKPEKIAPNIGDYMDNLKIFQQPHGLAD